jgi:hypothetical protein
MDYTSDRIIEISTAFYDLYFKEQQKISHIDIAENSDRPYFVMDDEKFLTLLPPICKMEAELLATMINESGSYHE